MTTAVSASSTGWRSLLCLPHSWFCGLLDTPVPTTRPPLVPRTVHASLRPDQSRPRTIIVGDLHGCLDELHDLLAACDYDPSTTRVVMLGDLVNKGPHSVASVDFVRRSGFACVRGNHDDCALAAWERRSAEVRDGGAANPNDAYAYTDGFTSEDVQFLRELPYTIYLQTDGVLVVHAGIVPGVALHKQQLLAMYTMRDLLRPPDSSGSDRWVWLSQPSPASTPWAAVWKPDPAANGTPAQHVVFGHDAKRNLQQHSHATGLDTGCCYGRQLTALVLPSRTIVSVPARRTYATPPDAG